MISRIKNTFISNKNIAYNYFSSLIIFLTNILVTPLYLKYLGAENWNILAINISYLSIFALLQSGFLLSLPKFILNVHVKSHRKIIDSYIYLVFFIILILLPVVIIYSIFSFKLNFIYVAVLFGINLLNSVSYTYLLSKSDFFALNLITILATVVKSVTYLCLIYYFNDKNITNYFIVFILISIIEFFLLRKLHRFPFNFNYSVVYIKYIFFRGWFSMIPSLFFGILLFNFDRYVFLISDSIYLKNFYGGFFIISNLILGFNVLHVGAIKTYIPLIINDVNNGFKDWKIIFYSYFKKIFILYFFLIISLNYFSNFIINKFTVNSYLVYYDQFKILIGVLSISLLVNGTYNLIYHYILYSSIKNILNYVNLIVLAVVMICSLYLFIDVSIVIYFYTIINILQLTIGFFFFRYRILKKVYKTK